MSSYYRLNLLNGFQLLVDGQPANSIHAPRLQALLAYLALNRRTPQPRQQVAFLMWPDATESQARTNLRKAIHTLKQMIPSAEIFLDRDGTLQWNPDAPCALDVAEFEATVSAGALEQAVASYSGDLLPNCYDEWALRERERLRQCYGEALERLIRQKEDECDTAAALGFAQRLLHCEPLREEIYRHIMRLHASNGDRSAALLTYQACATLLERELGVEPSPATRQVYERLLEPGSPQKLPPLAGSLPLVGRVTEWDSLRRVWHAAARGQPQMALIRGEAGIGKTRLAEELLAWVDRQGLLVSSAYCYAAEGASAYAPVTTWLRERSLSHLEPVWRSEVARLLPELAEDASGVIIPGPLTQAWQRQSFHEALARAVLGADLAICQPQLLLLEDLQWCDGDTLAWLNYLLRYNARARLLVVGTLRSEATPDDGPLPALLADLRRRGLLTEVGLQPLDPMDTTRLGESVLGQALDAETAASLYRETEGNPLFIVEFARAGLMLAVDAVEAGTTGLPPLVQAAVASRLTRLSQPAQHTMHLAAVIGREFTFDVLFRAAGQDEESLVDALDELWQRRVIREQGKNAYDFSHDKLRQVAYAGLSATRRRRLHKQVAEALSIVYAQHPDPVSGQIGWHYEQAGDDQAAAEWLWKAGDGSARIGAYLEAVAYLMRALALLPVDDPRRAELLCRIGTESAIPYGGDQEMEYLRQGLDLAQQIGDHRTMALASLSMSHAMSTRGQNFDATCLAQAALVHAEAVDDRGTRGRALISLGTLAYYRREYTQAMQYLEKGLTIFQNLDNPLAQNISDIMAHTLNYMGLTCLDQGDFEAAGQHWHRALDLCEKSGNRPVQTALVINLAWMAFVRGDFNEAETRQFEAIRLCRETGDHGGLAVAHNTLGHVALRKEQLDAALKNYQIGLREATYFYTTPMALETLAGLAGVWARSGQAVHAAELLGLAMSHPHTSPEVAQIAPYVHQLLQAVLPPAELETALQRGRQLDLDQVVRKTLDDLIESERVVKTNSKRL